MSFAIRTTLPVRSGIKSIAGNVIISSSTTPNFHINGPTGPIGYTGPTGSSGGGGSSIVSGTQSININSFTASSSYTGTVSLSGFSSTPKVVLSSSIGSAAVTDKTQSSFSYRISGISPIPSVIDTNGVNFLSVNPRNNCHMTIANGNPAVTYNDTTTTNINFSRSVDSLGAIWNPPVVAATGGVVNVDTSLCIVNGNPAISFWNLNSSLRYTRSVDSNGSVWGTPIIVASTGSVGAFSSLNVVNGMPAIIYYDSTNTDLRYIRSLDVNGDSWGDAVTIASTGTVGSSSSNKLTIVNGNPAAIYQSTTGTFGILYYSRSNDINGDTWGPSILVDPSISRLGKADIAIVDGNPAVSYTESVSGIGRLKYVRSLDVNGNSWGTPVVVDINSQSTFSVAASFMGLSVVDNLPVVVFIDTSNTGQNYIKYAKSTDVNGTSWSVYSLAYTGNGSTMSNIELISGLPSFAYIEGYTTDVKFLRSENTSIDIDYIAV